MLYTLTTYYIVCYYTKLMLQTFATFTKKRNQEEAIS